MRNNYPDIRETLLIKIKGNRKPTLGYVDGDNKWHELSPYKSGGNDNELYTEVVLGWKYFDECLAEDWDGLWLPLMVE